MLVQLLADQPSGAVQPGLDGFRPNAEDLSSVFDAHSLDHPRDENNSIDFGEIVGRLFDKLKNLTLSRRSFRVVGF